MIPFDNLHLFEYDHTKYDGINPPFCIRHKDGTAQVCYERNKDGLPIRVPGYLVDADLAWHLTDREIIKFGIDHLLDFKLELSRTQFSDN